jgi:hypothetical protein
MLGFVKGLHEVMSKSSNVKRTTNMSDLKPRLSVKPRLNDVVLFLQEMTENRVDTEIGNKKMSITQKEDEQPRSSPIRLIIEHAKESASDTLKTNPPQDMLDNTPDNCKNYLFDL